MWQTCLESTKAALRPAVLGAEAPLLLPRYNVNRTQNKDFDQIWFASRLIFSMTSKNKLTKILQGTTFLPQCFSDYQTALKVRPDHTGRVPGDAWEGSVSLEFLESEASPGTAVGSGRQRLWEPRRELPWVPGHPGRVDSGRGGCFILCPRNASTILSLHRAKSNNSMAGALPVHKNKHQVSRILKVPSVPKHLQPTEN